MEKKKGLSLQTILTIAGLALVYLLAFLLDRIPGVPIMLTTVLRKGAIYSLVAVSMNLLNGFTGLFSLGQAGFMLLGAYTYAILTGPMAARTRLPPSTFQAASARPCISIMTRCSTSP